MPDHERIKLDPHPARSDLSDRECAKIISGTMGTLLQMTTKDNLKRAIQFCADNADELIELTLAG